MTTGLPARPTRYADSGSLRSAVVIGQTESAWLTASMLATAAPHIQVTVVQVGNDTAAEEYPLESVPPEYRTVFQSLNLREEDVLRTCDGTYSLAERLCQWRPGGKDVWIPSTTQAPSQGELDVIRIWHAEQCQTGSRRPLTSLRLEWNAAIAGLGPIPTESAQNNHLFPSYGFMADGVKLTQMLRNTAIDRGVRMIPASRVSAGRDSMQLVRSVTVDQSSEIPVDLVIDCTETSIASEQNIWRKDSDFPELYRTYVSEPAGRRRSPYTSAGSIRNGFWKSVSLWSADRHASYSINKPTDVPEVCAVDFRNAGQTVHHAMKPIHSDKIPVRPGRRQYAWHQNVVSIGAAFACLHPLANSGRRITLLGIELLLDCLHGPIPAPAIVRHYNQVMSEAYASWNDFAMMQWFLNEHQVDDQGLQLTHGTRNRLNSRLQLFCECGVPGPAVSGGCPESTWWYLLTGCDQIPAVTRLTMQQQSLRRAEFLKNISAEIRRLSGQLPRHEDALHAIHGNGILRSA